MRISQLFQRTALLRTTRAAILTSMLISVHGSTTAIAQDAAPDENAETEEGEAAEEEKQRPLIDLGSFKIHDLRPTRNETAKLTFSMHLAFSKELSEAQVETLQAWKHRLRDQVITAVRISTIKDFQEPDLNRLSRKILIRVNRLFKKNLAEEVLLNEYMFRTH